MPTVKVAMVAPWATVTLGREAASAVFELESATSVPPKGAGALSVTVPVDEPPLPPAMLDGLSVKDVTVWA